jgi:hypothetical protein
MWVLSRVTYGIVPVAMGLGLLCAGCSSAHPSAAHPSASTRSATTQLATLSCAWPIAVNADTLSANSELNIHNPDTASAYWLMAYTVEDGMRLTLSGHFPDSRYMSLEVYTSDGLPFSANGVGSALADYQIAPDPGSVNPWQHEAAPGGSFTVTLEPDASPGQANVLPLAPAGTPAGTTGLIFLRVYVPAYGNPRQVPLPAVTVTLDGASRQLPTCPASSALNSQAAAQVRRALGLSLPASGSTPAGSAPAGIGRGEIVPFALGSAAVGSTPDTDTRYLSAVAEPPQDGDVLVIRARAPTVPAGPAPVPWPAPGVDVRYWSICNDLLASPTPVVVNHLPHEKVDLGCRYDRQIALDRQGYYTIVIGAESQRAAIERIPGATFIPWSLADPGQPYKIYLRNMLPNPAFAEAIQNVPANGDPASAATVMGPYYPRLGFCSLRILAASGPDACLAGPA